MAKMADGKLEALNVTGPGGAEPQGQPAVSGGLFITGLAKETAAQQLAYFGQRGETWVLLLRAQDMISTWSRRTS